MGVAVPAILGGVALAGQVGGLIQRDQQRRANEGFNSQRKRILSGLAIDTFLEQSGQVRQRTSEERSQIVEELRNLTTEALRTRGAQAASAAAGGVSGVSVGDIQLDTVRAESVVQGRLGQLQEFREAAAEARLRNLRIEKRSRLLDAFFGVPPIPQPNRFNDLLSIAQVGAAGFATGLSIQSSLGAVSTPPVT